ncbi:outer membrane efflux protein [Labilithrix luteola]|uniref:Outer membrane efflux protein n=1 Tax=Labilithrix luteola TaxID=1391654 RepID=A0A0K1PUM2_9BACT|nr:TolC family protein [Labilithrix luteola]AKU97081.1 outer membrane efflux protein [Labilithrix luteola]
MFRSRTSWLATAVLAAVLAASSQARAEAPPPPPPSPTEEAPVRTITLEEAVRIALTQQPRIAAARSRFEAAKRDAEVPGAEWLPRLAAVAQLVGSTANNSTTTILGTSGLDLPRIGGTRVTDSPDMQPYASTVVAIGLRQELYDFGRIAAAKAAATLQADVERHRVANTELDVSYGVAEAYYAVLAATAIEEASRAAYDRAVQHRDFARANVTSGLRPPIELTRAEADVARYDAATTRATGSLHIARSVLALAVGADDAEIGASARPAPADPLPRLADLRGRADETPIVAEGRARVEATRAETKRLEAQTRPNLMATASISGRAGGATPSAGPVPDGNGWIPLVPNYDAGVLLTWPILDPMWGRRADASRAREQAAKADLDNVRRNQRQFVSSAWQEAKVTTEALAALQRGADAGKANYDQADHRFHVGLGTSTELADAQALRTEADIQLAIGRFQAARARAALDRAIGEIR